MWQKGDRDNKVDEFRVYEKSKLQLSLKHIWCQKWPACLSPWNSPGQDKVVTGADVTQHLPQLELQLADGSHSILDKKYHLA